MSLKTPTTLRPLFAAALLLAARAAVADESYVSRLCDSPSNLTGSLAIATGAPSVGDASTAWDGAAFGVAWSDSRTGNDEIWFARVAADGTLLAGPKQVTSATGASLAPSLAWNGDGWGVAFEDNRGGNYDLRFARLTADGDLLGADVAIAPASGDGRFASLAWNGTEMGLAWQDDRAGNPEIWFARLDADGTAIGAPLRVTSDAGWSARPSLAATTGGWTLAWTDDRDGNWEIYTARISSAGAKVGGDNRVTNDAATSQAPSLAWSGTELALAWEDNRDGNFEIYAARLSEPGLKPGSDLRITSDSANSAQPSVAWTGAEWGIAWRDTRDGNAEMYFARLSAGGAKQGGDLRLTTDLGTSVPTSRALAFGTLGYVVAYRLTAPESIRVVGIGCHADWTAPTCPTGLAVTGNSSAGVTLQWLVPGEDPETEVAYHRIHRDGAVIGYATATSFTDSPRPAGTPAYAVVAVNALGLASSGCAVVAAPEPTGDCGANWTGAQTATQSPGEIGSVSIAWNGTEYGIAWSDTRSGGPAEIWFRRISAAGVPLGAEIRVTNDSASSLAPSIAWNGASWGIAWHDNRSILGDDDVWFRRLAPDGALLGPESRITTDPSNSATVSLAAADNGWGVAWVDQRDGNEEIYFARLDPSGTNTFGEVRVSNGPGPSAYPSVAWTGASFAVAWEDERLGPAEIYAARLSAINGLPLAPESRVSNSGAGAYEPSLAFDGSGFGVAWYDGRTGNFEIWFARLASSLAKIGSDVRVSNDPEDSYSPSLVWTGTEYSVAWEDSRWGNFDVWGASLDPSGNRLGAERRLTSSAYHEATARLAVGGRGIGLAARRFLITGMEMLFLGLGCGPLDSSPPTCPASPAVSARGASSLTLSWGSALETDSDFAHYEIRKNASLVGATTALSWTDTSFDPAAGGIFRVTAVNAAGFASPGCAAIDASDHVPPTCVGNLLATVAAGPSVSLDWLPASDATSGLADYVVYRNSVALPGGVVPAGTTSYTDATPAAGTTYNYAVLARDRAGNLSANCPNAGTTIWVSTSPIVLTLGEKGDGVHASLDWNDAGLPEYVVYRSTSPQVSGELKRVGTSETDDPVLGDGVACWYYHIQQRE